MFDLTATPVSGTMPQTPRPDPMAPLQQSTLWACAAARLGARVDVVDLSGNAAVVVSRKFPVIGDTALISRGPARFGVASAQALAGTLAARHIIVNAEDSASAEALARAGFWRIARPRRIAEVPLHLSCDAMAARLLPKWRNRLRHAMKSDLRVTRQPMPPNPRHWLFSAEACAARRLGYRPMPAAMVAALAAAGAGAGQLFVARHGPDIVAAMVFLRHGRVATYQIGWSSDAGRALSAHNLLLWRAMVDLSALGIRRLDLGAADPASPGLAHFKRGAGAGLRWLGGTWLCSPVLPRRRRGAAATPDPRPA